MIDATETLLRERGLVGAGIKQVVARCGAPVGSVYHFFPGGKTQLVAEALRQHAGKATRLFRQAFADEATPLPARVRALFRTAAEGFERAGADKSCAVAAVTLDLDARDQELRQVCRAGFDQWIAEIAAHLPWPHAETRHAFATMIVVAFEGAFILARADHSGRAFLTAGDWLARLAESAPPSSPGESHAVGSAPRRRPASRVHRSDPTRGRRAMPRERRAGDSPL